MKIDKPLSLSLSLSYFLQFQSFVGVLYVPLCAFKNKLRMTERETLFAIEQVVLKLYFIVMKLLFYNCDFKNNNIGYTQKFHICNFYSVN